MATVGVKGLSSINTRNVDRGEQ